MSRTPRYVDDSPPAAGPIHWRWCDGRYWQWVAERIAILDQEAARADARKAEQGA